MVSYTKHLEIHYLRGQNDVWQLGGHLAMMSFESLARCTALFCKFGRVSVIWANFSSTETIFC